MWEGLRKLLGLGRERDWWDEHVTYKEFYQTRDKNVLITAPRWLWLFIGDQLGLTSSGVPTVDSSGQRLTKEASAATISGNTTYLLNAAYATSSNAQFVAHSSGELVYRQPRTFATTFTATAGGEIVSAELIPAVAGYKNVAVITGIWSDQTDPSIALAITAASGIAKGPSAWTIGVTAGQVTDYSPGVPIKTTAANEAISLSCAAGQAQANQVLIVIGTYHLEGS